MGVLYDYFIAASDAEAAATINRPGGPGEPVLSAPPKGRGLFTRRRQQESPNTDGAVYATVAETGIDPVVQGGTLEELLTGRPYEEIEQDPRSGHSLATRDGGERMVLTLTDGLIDALAQSSSDQLAAAAGPWSQTEEFWGAGDPEQLAALLIDLSALARDARVRGEAVYCWVSV